MKHAVGDDWGRLRSRVRRVCVFTSAVCARVPVSISAHLSPSVRSSVRPSVRSSVYLSVGQPVGRFDPHARKRERERGKRETRGWAGVRPLSDPTVGHATELADPICGMEEILCRIMDNGRTRHGPNRTVNLSCTKNPGRLRRRENRPVIFRF